MQAMSLTISELPHKEQALFRTALKLYETHQYKKGFKTCDQILKRVPNHGETLAVRGMFLTNMDRKEEGYENIRKGLEITPGSSISWHVYGIVNRNDKNYAEAIKCYEKALTVDSENMHILRDLAQLQMHQRQYGKAIETRNRLVKLNSNPSVFWLGLAVCHHMMGRYDLALDVISKHENSANDDPVMEKNEISEMLLYKNWLMVLNGDYQKALEHLKEIRSRITDITGWKEQKAELLLKLDRREAAALAYQDLIERNPDNNGYIQGYLVCNGLDTNRAEDTEAVLEIIHGLQSQFPSSNMLKFLPLTFCVGDDFTKAADKLAKYSLRKGIPSLFASMKVLYGDVTKSSTLYKLVDGYATQLRDTKRFDDSTEDEPRSAYTWCVFYLAQHWDYHGEHERALELIEEAIRDSPDTAELYAVKAKILKHAGDIRGACNVMDFGRQKDLQDRFINSKAVKYMLRVNDVDEAEKTMVMFVRDDAPHKIQELLDTQTIWYMLERGQAYLRLGDLGRALKQFHQVLHCYDTFHIDQFDFHSYSIRKATLRAYVDMLQWEDQLFTDKPFVRAAHATINCYVDLYDRQLGGSPFKPIVDESRDKPLTRNGTAKKGQHNLSSGVGEAKQAEVDKDPNGSKFVESSDHLAEAIKLVETLETYVGSQPETHLSAFEVHLRMKKYFLVLKAINALKAIDADHPALVSMVVRMREALAADDSFAAPMKAALGGQLNKAFGETTIEDTIKTHSESLDHALSGAHGMVALSRDNDTVKNLLLRAASNSSYGETRTLANLQRAKQLLQKCGASQAELKEFSISAKKLFPLSTCF